MLLSSPVGYGSTEAGGPICLIGDDAPRIGGDVFVLSPPSGILSPPSDDDSSWSLCVGDRNALDVIAVSTPSSAVIADAVYVMLPWLGGVTCK